MLSDIEIAQQAEMQKIREVAAGLSIEEDDLEYYGHYKAKLSESLFQKLEDKPNGKLILVTAINPTPAGEGKTTVSVGLADALRCIGKKSVVALREPSLGPVFGIKGGAAGGGYSQVVPMEDINLHFTGDMHAITAANNLLCAMLDNHMQQGNVLRIDQRRVMFKRVLDMNDASQSTVIHIQNPFKHHSPLAQIRRTLPCCIWLSSIAQSKLLAAVMACISPVKCRLMSSIGTTCE